MASLPSPFAARIEQKKPEVALRIPPKQCLARIPTARNNSTDFPTFAAVARYLLRLSVQQTLLYFDTIAGIRGKRSNAPRVQL
jgi:hypothetical protein